MSHNVPIVYDGLATRISKPQGLQGCQTVGVGLRGNGVAMT
jgi:hypothetical protein